MTSVNQSIQTNSSFYELFCKLFEIEHLIVYTFFCVPTIAIIGFIFGFLLVFPIIDITIAFTQTSCTDIPNLFVTLTFKEGLLLFLSSEWLLTGTLLFVYFYHKCNNASVETKETKNNNLFIYVISIELILCLSTFITEIVMLTSNTHNVNQCLDLWVQDYLTNELVIVARILSFVFGITAVLAIGVCKIYDDKVNKLEANSPNSFVV